MYGSEDKKLKRQVYTSLGSLGKRGIKLGHTHMNIRFKAIM